MRVRVNWCRTCGRNNNFGDQLGPKLLALVDIKAEWSPPATAQLVTVGSILSKFTPDYTGAIWGTGLIKDTRARFPRARVVSVRGELTRERARLPKGTPLGDPGVLSGDLLAGVDVTPSDLSLIVPHTIDHDMAGRHLGRRMADIAGDHIELLKAIAESGVVYTSSLHAMIAADALGVPQVYEPHPAVIGGDWKFNDYLSVFGEYIRPGVERLTPRPMMLAKQEEVRAQLQSLRILWTRG